MGACPILNVFGTVEIPKSGRVVNSWNYDNSTHEITGFLSPLITGDISFLFFIPSSFSIPHLSSLSLFLTPFFFDVQHTFRSAGFVYSGSEAPSVSHINPKCPITCSLYVDAVLYFCLFFCLFFFLLLVPK